MGSCNQLSSMQVPVQKMKTTIQTGGEETLLNCNYGLPFGSGLLRGQNWVLRFSEGKLTASQFRMAVFSTQILYKNYL